MSRRGKQFRKNVVIIELVNLVWFIILLKSGIGWFGFWKNLLYLAVCLLVAFFAIAIYNIVSVNKEQVWQRQEIKKAADKMAGINLQLRQVFPHCLSREGNLELSRWWGKDEKIVKTYLYRYCRRIKVDQNLLDAVNWCYRLGWYRSKDEIKLKDEQISQLEQEIESLEEQLQNCIASTITESIANVQTEGEQASILHLDNDLEENIKKLLLEGVKQTDIAQLLGTNQSKVSRVKKKYCI